METKRVVWDCGCEVEQIETRHGRHYVPLQACPEHCPCVACKQMRAVLARRGVANG